jgi:hypothetical protein
LDNAESPFGKSNTTSSALGKNSISSSHPVRPIDLKNEGLGNGSWNLHLDDLATAADGKTVTGQAKAILSFQQELTFAVKGTYDAKKKTAKLVLTDTQTAADNSLQVGLVNNGITKIKGKILGQSVDVK